MLGSLLCGLSMQHLPLVHALSTAGGTLWGRWWKLQDIGPKEAGNDFWRLHLGPSPSISASCWPGGETLPRHHDVLPSHGAKRLSTEPLRWWAKVNLSSLKITYVIPPKKKKKKKERKKRNLTHCPHGCWKFCVICVHVGDMFKVCSLFLYGLSLLNP
jgi:hypothetical protein